MPFKLKRPLFAAAVCILSLITLFLKILPYSEDENTSVLLSQEGSTIILTGTVTRADSKYVYLNRIKYISFSEEPDDCTQASCSTRQYSRCAPYTELNRKIMIVVPCEDISDDFSIGNSLKITGTFSTFSSASNPGQFDAYSYYRNLRIYGKISPESMSVTDGKIRIFPEFFHRMRLFISDRIDTVFPGKEASVIKDLMLGDKAGLDPDVKALYQRNGIAHILSVSSLHVSLLGYGLFRLLRKFGASNKVSALTGTAVLIGYGMMTGFGTSAVRAICIFSLAMGAKILGRTSDSLTSLSVAAIVLAFANPDCICSCGFLLSFGSALGIFVFCPSLRRLFLPADTKIHRYEEKNKLSHVKKLFLKFIQSLGNSLLTSISITLTTLPIQLYFFCEVPTYSCLINSAVLPFLSFLMISSLFALFPLFQIPAAFVSCGILKWYEFLCGLFDRLPFNSWNPGCPGMAVIIIYYIFWIVFVVAADLLRSGRIKTFKKKPSIVLFKAAAAVTAIMLFIFLSLPKVSPGTAVFLDVGQGDCILIYTGNRDVYLFDGGSTSSTNVGKYVIKPALKYYGFSQIDAVFISHTDLDHYSGIAEILENKEDWNISVKRMYFPDTENLAEESGYAALIKNSEDTYIGYVSEGDTWQSGSTIFTCLHPPKGYTAEDINAASACFYVSFGSGGASLLLCGDVTGEGEENLTENLSYFPPVTVLKVAHHGSRNSTSEEFLSAAVPSAAIISAGKNNRYGHPHAETLERLSEENCRIYVTAESGAITARFNSNRPQAKISCFIKKK